MAFRDCKAWADEKLPLTTTNNEAAKLLDDAITQYITWAENPEHGGLEGTVGKILQADPTFTMGKVLSVGLDSMGTARSIRLDKEFENQVSDLEECIKNSSANAREKLHCQAVAYFAREKHTKACETWEEILVDHPNDSLALKFAHDSYFYLGNSVLIRDSIGRVLPYMDPSDRYYGYVKGMYAFGLEETNYFDLAEKYAREALTLNPTDCWSTHALAHCFEMSGRTLEGIKFMGSTENDWRPGGMLACHNYWHWSLYYLENGMVSETLALYDKEVGERIKAGVPLDLVDAASLLKRLEFEGVDVGHRWNDLYDLCRPHLDDHLTAFNDLHFLMAFIGARDTREDVVELYKTSMNDYLGTGEGTNHDVMNEVGNNVFDGLVAYGEKRYDDAVDLLHPVKYKVVKVGGSNAQRDVFSQLLLYSCINSVKPKNRKLGRALIQERKLLKEKSPLTDRMMIRLLGCHD